ncbi:RDD family protein [Bacillus sp. ISL-41]|nr:RDD family protein [Bacillus sp. ISL-41]
MNSSEPSENRSGYQSETDRPALQSDSGNIQIQDIPEADIYIKGGIEPENHIYAGLYAGFWTRFWAYLLDLIVIGSINRMIINPVFRALDVSLIEDGIFSPMAIATAIVFYLYFVLMTKFSGQTLGKMVFGLKVVELDGKGLSWGTVIFREWIGRFISATIMILYVVVAFTKKKQGLHDLFADTTVIYEPR